MFFFHYTAQSYFTVFHFNLDFRCINFGMHRQTFVDVFFDAIIRPFPSLRSFTGKPATLRFRSAEAFLTERTTKGGTLAGGTEMLAALLAGTITLLPESLLP